MTKAPSTIAIAVPYTPELGRNFFPGFIKDPQPTTHPNAMAQTCMGDTTDVANFLHYYPAFYQSQM